ncbi:secretory lipase-domain-containing protein [Aspergillus heterothallicus]
MRPRLFLLFRLVYLATPFLSAAAPHERGGPLLPTEDPFYTPPSGYEFKAPGTILRHRTPPFPIAAFGLVEANIKASHQILYRSSDSFNEPIATVTTVLIPNNADHTKVLSYQVAQDAADPNCSPSFALQQFSDAGEALALIMPQLEYLLIAVALSKGWIVTIPDHLGPKSAFLANTLSGHATLDGIRATLASGSFTNVSPRSTVTMWGYSGGSLASGFAAELQPDYAPELNIAGAALGGTVPKISPVIEAVNKGIFTGFIPAGIQGLASEYPVAQTIISESLLPNKVADFNKTQSLCLTGNIVEYIGQDIYSYVKDPGVFTSAPVTALLDATTWVSPIHDTDELYSYYCANGAAVTYTRDLASEHVTLGVTGAPDAFLWLVDRMNGKAVKPGCSKSTELTSLLDPRAIAVFGVRIFRVLLSFLSFPLGPPSF